jgi:hypothetical protein
MTLRIAWHIIRISESDLRASPEVEVGKVVEAINAERCFQFREFASKPDADGLP